jgi:hypothetical protein
MDDNTKNNRIALWRGSNFGGITDWAVDLQSFMPSQQKGNEKSNGPGANQIAQKCSNGFLQETCANLVVSASDWEPLVRWHGVCTDEAWEAALQYWDGLKKNVSFSSAVGKFFNNNGESLNCQVLTDGSCNSPGCLDLNCPAGYFILNSFARIHQVRAIAQKPPHHCKMF